VNPEIHLKTDEMTLEEEVQIILDHLMSNNFIQSGGLAVAGASS